MATRSIRFFTGIIVAIALFTTIALTFLSNNPTKTQPQVHLANPSYVPDHESAGQATSAPIRRDLLLGDHSIQIDVKVLEKGSDSPAVGARVTVFVGVNSAGVHSSPDWNSVEWIPVNDDGECGIQIDRNDFYEVSIVAERRGAMSEISTISLDELRVDPEQILVLPGLGRVTGTVAGSSEELATTEISLVSTSGPLKPNGFYSFPAEEDGSFEFPEIPAGVWTITFSAKDRPVKRYSNIIVEPGEVAKANHSWFHRGSLTVVLSEQSGDRIGSTYEYSLIASDHSSWNRGRISGGIKTISGVPSGTYRIEVHPVDYKVTSDSRLFFDNTSIEIEDANAQVNLVGRPRTSSIEGDVFCGAKKLSRGTVVATQRDGTQASSKIEDGTFRISGLASGEVTLRWKIKGIEETGYNIVQIEKEGTTVHDIHIPEQQVQISVVSKEDGKPIGGCPIRLEDSNGFVIENGPGMPFFADPLGRLTLMGLKASKYDLIVGPAMMPNGLHGDYETKRIEIDLNSSVQSKAVRVELQACHQMRLTVQDSSGNPISGANAFAFNSGHKPLTYSSWEESDTDGTLSIPFHPESMSLLVVRHKSYAPTMVRVPNSRPLDTIKVTLNTGVPVSFEGAPATGLFPKLIIQEAGGRINLAQTLFTDNKLNGSLTLGVFSNKETVYLNPGDYVAWTESSIDRAKPTKFTVFPNASLITIHLN